MVAMSLSWAGCASLQSAVEGNSENLEITKISPMPTLVASGQELVAAEQHAVRDSACFALSGAGRSMEPIYTSGTAIVVREQSYRMLRAGQVIVYRNGRGCFVAHILVKELNDGWIATGLNNAKPDGELVTSGNFVGVVMAAYASSRSPTPTELVVRRAIQDGVENGTRTASLP